MRNKSEFELVVELNLEACAALFALEKARKERARMQKNQWAGIAQLLFGGGRKKKAARPYCTKKT